MLNGINNKNLKIALYILIIILLILSFVLLEKNKQLKLSDKIRKESIKLLNDISEINEIKEELKDHSIQLKEEDKGYEFPKKQPIEDVIIFKNRTDHSPEKYRVVAYHIGGIGTTIIDAFASDVSDYVIDTGHSYLKPSGDWTNISLNSMRDLMHGMCNDGYKMIECNNQDINTNSCTIELEEKYKNGMSFVCEKLK
jgi:hypothetical protein